MQRLKCSVAETRCWRRQERACSAQLLHKVTVGSTSRLTRSSSLQRALCPCQATQALSVPLQARRAAGCAAARAQRPTCTVAQGQCISQGSAAVAVRLRSRSQCRQAGKQCRVQQRATQHVYRQGEQHTVTTLSQHRERACRLCARWRHDRALEHRSVASGAAAAALLKGPRGAPSRLSSA